MTKIQTTVTMLNIPEHVTPKSFIFVYHTTAGTAMVRVMADPASRLSSIRDQIPRFLNPLLPPTETLYVFSINLSEGENSSSEELPYDLTVGEVMSMFRKRIFFTDAVIY